MKGRPVLVILNKGDLEEKIEKDEIYRAFPHVVEISAKEEGALQQLSEAVTAFLGVTRFDSDAPLLANERQRQCAVHAKAAVDEALNSLKMQITLDVCYALLDEALACLYELSGENASEEVINAVFENFCVGK